jgi:type 1 fimbria pilin
MSEILKRSVFSVLAPAIALALIATATNAQQAQAPGQAPAAQCTAQATPAEVATGQAAVKLSFTLSAPIGAVSGVEAPEGSGIALAAATDIPREGMANPAEQPRPIDLAADTNTLTLWIKTAGVQAGEFPLKLQGENGSCTVTVTVK